MAHKPTIFTEGSEGPGPLGSTGSIHIDKEATQHGIIKSTEKPKHGGAGFATVGSIATDKEPTAHGIVRSEEKAQHQGSGFASTGSNFIEKEPTAHGIVRSQEKAQYGGSGFASTGSIATEKEKTSHGIVRSEEKAQYQGAGFATMGSIPTEKEATGHGIIAAGTKIKEGPADAGTDAMAAHFEARKEAKLDKSREAKVKAWLEGALGETFTEESLQESLKNGERLCKALNLVYPATIPKISTSAVVFSQRENVSNYVKGCGRLGFNKSNLFEVADLFDNKNMTKVIENLYELAHFGSRKPGLPKIEE